MGHISRFTCEETFRRLDDYLDRELDASDVERVRQHLETCSVCAGEYAFEAGVLSSVREKVQRISAPPNLMAKVLARLSRDTTKPL